MSLDCAEYPKDKTYPIYYLCYGTHVSSINEAIVSADSLGQAETFLKQYLIKNPLNPKFPNMTLPSRYHSAKQLEYRTTTSGVIYCSLDSHRK